MAGTLTIDRLQATYVVPRDEARPDAARARLDHVIRSSLTDACRRRLASIGGDDGVWLIRALDMDLTLPGPADEHDMADVLATEIERSLNATVRTGPDGEHVVFFPTRPAFLAHVCAEIASGRLWARWYGRAFDGLRAQASGAAVATLIQREPEHAGETIMILRALGRLDDVLGVLTERDARVVLDAWTRGRSPGVAALRAAARAILIAARPSATPRVGSARILDVMAALCAASSVPSAEARGAAEIVSGAVDVLVRRGIGAFDEMRSGRLSAVARALAGSPVAERLPGLAAAVASDDEWWRTLTSWIAPETVPPGEAAAGSQVATPFGGAFLLLPALVEMEEALFSAMPDEERPRERLDVLAACFGHERSAGARADPILRMLAGASADDLSEHPAVYAGLEPIGQSVPLSKEDHAFLAAGEESERARARAHAARAVLDGFARRLLGFQRSSAAYLVRNFLDVPASLADEEGAWEARVAAPPLALVLRMTGIVGTSLHVPWLGRDVTIRLEEQ